MPIHMEDQQYQDEQIIGATGATGAGTDLPLNGSGSTLVVVPSNYFMIVDGLSLANTSVALVATLQIVKGATIIPVFEISLSATSSFNGAHRQNFVIIVPAGFKLQVKTSVGTIDVVANVRLLEGGT